MSVSSKLAFIFPGQGSQKLGMLNDFYQKYTVVKETLKEANEILGFDLWEIMQNDENKLSQTAFTQPALLASSIAIYRVLIEKSQRYPILMAGHSLGEYSALVAAGSLSFSDGLKLVHLRGQLMQEAVASDVGSMSAILGLDDESVMSACQKAQDKGIVSAANFNSPGQVVIAGEKEAVMYASEIAKELGAKRAQILPVSVPSHCLLMKPAASKLLDVLNNIEINKPKISVLHNVDVETHAHPDEIRHALVKQLYSPVQWSKTITTIAQDGVRVFVEVGSGKVLTGLNKRIVKDVVTMTTDPLEHFDQVLKTLASI
ncbi:ACP S-malonyltransferase [Thiotrichales bacterium 19S9-12]|nr:ACP S-malonyltransferase [Thiotrichales bacterium 19S9-11]MCF6811060.1 ACP S-malonyltransferase [Thiotrichales bacterium 19S9-12]